MATITATTTTTTTSSPDLTPARQHLLEHGWCRVPSVLSKDEAAAALGKLWAAKEAAEQRGDPTHLSFLDPNASNVRVFYLMVLDKIFRDLISHPTAIEMVKTVLGDDFLISNFTANIARPGSQSMALHSDQSIVFPDPWKDVWALNIIWCLTDVHKDNGATLYIPGSNKWTTRAEVPSNAPDLLVPFEAKAGDFLVMDGRVWHTSGHNVTKDEDRALLFGYYTKPFMRQQENWTARITPEIKETLSDDLKGWLGLGEMGNIGVTGDLRYMSMQYPKEGEEQKAESAAVAAPAS